MSSCSAPPPAQQVDPIMYAKTREVANFWSCFASDDLFFSKEVFFLREFIRAMHRRLEAGLSGSKVRGTEGSESERQETRRDPPGAAAVGNNPFHNDVGLLASFRRTSAQPHLQNVARESPERSGGTDESCAGQQQPQASVGEVNDPKPNPIHDTSARSSSSSAADHVDMGAPPGVQERARKKRKWEEVSSVKEKNPPPIRIEPYAAAAPGATTTSSTGTAARASGPRPKTTSGRDGSGGGRSPSDSRVEGDRGRFLIPSDAEDEERLHPEPLSDEYFSRRQAEPLTENELLSVQEWSSCMAECVEGGELENASSYMTKILKLGKGTAMQFAKRGDLFLRLRKPAAAVRDADRALELNPDSAKAYKVRGKANRKLQRWDAAHSDLETAQRLDFDDELEGVRKFVLAKWKKLEQVRVKQRISDEKNKADLLKKEIEMRRRRMAEEKLIEEKRKKDEEAKKKEDAERMASREKTFEAFLNNQKYGGVGPAPKPFQGNVYTIPPVQPGGGGFDRTGAPAGVGGSMGMGNGAGAHGAANGMPGTNVYSAYGSSASRMPQPTNFVRSTMSQPASHQPPTQHPPPATSASASSIDMSGFFFDPAQMPSVGQQHQQGGPGPGPPSGGAGNFEAYDPLAEPEIEILREMTGRSRSRSRGRRNKGKPSAGASASGGKSGHAAAGKPGDKYVSL